MRRTFVVATVVTLLALAVPARAEPGQLDRFFSDDGRQTAFAHGATGYAVAVDRQGRIVVAGYTLGGQADVALARFMPNGEPDTEFGGGDGRVTTDLGAVDYAFDVAIGGGKIVVAGQRDQGDKSQIAVLRYGPRGNLDTTFSKDGKIFSDFGKVFQQANAVTIAGNGNILVGGYTSNGTSSRWAMVRYKPGGGLDHDFGGDGKVSVDLSTTDEQIEDIVVAPGGRILAAGYAEQSFIPQFAIAQFFSGGRFDGGFGDGGKKLVDVSDGSDTGYAMALQDDGKIVVAGYADHGGRGDWGLVRFGPKGHLDQSFAGDGTRVTSFGPGYEYASGVAIQQNGKILAVGRVIRKSGDLCVLRYLDQGRLDKAFGGDGRTCTDFYSGSDVGRDVALQKNGKIVVGGEAVRGSTRRFAIARYLGS
jgi:uncharacterized delta-60 repeat protein